MLDSLRTTLEKLQQIGIWQQKQNEEWNQKVQLDNSKFKKMANAIISGCFSVESKPGVLLHPNSELTPLGINSGEESGKIVRDADSN